MMVVATYLDRSSINGMGIFAKEDIPARAMMWEYVPSFDMEIRPESLPPLAREFILHYASMFAPGVYMLCGDNARFMNHSETPNMSGAGDQNFALREIRAGEEITCDYREFDLSFKGFSK